jgi:ubiquinone/menaquinone biosynthesis C-methylase UbiE
VATNKTTINESQLEKKNFVGDQEKYWDKKSSVYSRLNRNHEKKIQKIITLLELKNNFRVLEVGVGTGDHAKMFLDKTSCEKKEGRTIHFTGIDISKKMIEHASRKLEVHKSKNDNISLMIENGEKMNFADNTFDGVFCAAALHHLENPERGVKEILRVLKPGGRFVLMEPNLWFPKNLLQTIFIKEERNNKYITKKYYKKWINKFEIREAKIENFIFSAPFPEFCFSFYEFLDRSMDRVPLIKNLSIQLVLSGTKKMNELSREQ